jgi:hypothetical protein
MPYKERTKSEELIILGYLHARMNLEDSDKQHFQNLNKGYEGEVMFDNLTAGLQSKGIILNDLRFKVDNTELQIDTTIIFQYVSRFYEVKNHEGDHYFNKDNYCSWNGTVRKNPLHQMRKEEVLYKQVLKEIGCKLPLEPSLVFINPAFTMYNPPFEEPIIYPTQLNRHIDQLNRIPSSLTSYHWDIADKLKSMHMEKSEFTRLPVYKWGDVKKGFTCLKCNSFEVFIEGRKVVCVACNHIEEVEAAVLRSVGELKMLFPDKDLTTKMVQEWCGYNVSTKRIRGILEKNLNTAGSFRWTYYY